MKPQGKVRKFKLHRGRRASKVIIDEIDQFAETKIVHADRPVYPKKVPLTVYLYGARVELGEALVTGCEEGSEVLCFISPNGKKVLDQEKFDGLTASFSFRMPDING